MRFDIFCLNWLAFVDQVKSSAGRAFHWVIVRVDMGIYECLWMSLLLHVGEFLFLIQINPVIYKYYAKHNSALL